MLFKTTVNWLFKSIWCYLVTGCFDWKIGAFFNKQLQGFIISLRKRKYRRKKQQERTTIYKNRCLQFGDRRKIRGRTFPFGVVVQVALEAIKPTIWDIEEIK